MSIQQLDNFIKEYNEVFVYQLYRFPFSLCSISLQNVIMEEESLMKKIDLSFKQL